MFLPCNHQWLHCNHQWLQLQSLIYDYIGFFFVSLLYLYFVLFDAKKHPFGCFFLVSFGFGTVLFFGACRFPRVTRRGSSSGGGQICQNAEIPPSFMSLPCIFCKRMHLQYIEAFLVSTTAGALPQTPASLWAPQGQAVKTQPPDPVAKCWVGSKASRVKMHGFRRP